MTLILRYAARSLQAPYTLPSGPDTTAISASARRVFIGTPLVVRATVDDSRFNQAPFYADVLGHPERADLRRALDELRFFSEEVEVLGVYPADPFRTLATAGA